MNSALAVPMSVAGWLCVITCVRALHLFHNRLGICGRIVVAAVGWCFAAVLLNGDLMNASSLVDELMLSLGALAIVLLWQWRTLLHHDVDLPTKSAKLIALLLLSTILSFTGCAQYAQFARSYKRSYSVSYQDADGRDVSTTVTLDPVEGLQK